MGSQDEVRLTLTGKLSYSEQISVAQAAEIVRFLSSGDVAEASSGQIRGATGGGLGGGTTNRSNGQQVGMTPRQALEASGAKTNPEKIVTFAVLVSQQSDKETFTLDDVKPLFSQAREVTPGNFTRDLDAAIRIGFLAPATTKGEYYVVDKALNVLESGFEELRNVRGSRSRSTASSRRSRKPATVPEAFKGLELSPTVDGFINYHKVKTKTDRYLWAIHAAKLLGVDTVEPSDVAWVTDRLGDGVPRNDLNSYFRGNLKHGYVNKNAEGKVRITPDGVEYLKSLNAKIAK